MRIVTIPASGVSDIFQIAYDYCDRQIVFGVHDKYAVITPSFYGGRGYDTYKTLREAVIAREELREEGYQGSVIMDADGNDITGDTMYMQYEV